MDRLAVLRDTKKASIEDLLCPLLWTSSRLGEPAFVVLRLYIL